MLSKGVITIEKTFKYRIYPNKQQKELIQKTFGCSRYVYNYFLDLRIKKYKEEKILLNLNLCDKELTKLKKEKEWLKEPDKCSLQNALKDLDYAYQKFLKEHRNHPKFKTKKNNHKSYRTNFTRNNIRYENGHIKLPKLGFIKTRDKRVPEGRILNATIMQEPNGHYYCSLCCKIDNLVSFPKTNQNVGIDLGIVDFAIFSNGVKIENPKFYEKSEKKLKKLQKEMSRKTIGSSNYNKARIKYAKLQRHIVNQRNDFLHKITTQIIKEYDIIAIEDLPVKEMKETKNHIRNKRVGDVSWSRFRLYLTYKANWYNKQLVVIDRWYPSSQICHICSYQSGKKSENIRKWICPNCGNELDRDINASINILNEGIRILKV